MTQSSSSCALYTADSSGETDWNTVGDKLVAELVREVRFNCSLSMLTVKFVTRDLY